jgi:hypothetical protein
MTYFPLTKHGALETWLAGEIATLTSNVSAREARYLLLDAQLTDLEIRCAAAHGGASKKAPESGSGGSKDQ